MSKSVVGYGKIKRNGNTVELKINGKIAFNGQLIDMILGSRDECKVEVSIKEDSEPKTNPQLRRYFGVTVPYAQLGFRSIGWELTKERTDFELRMRFFAEEIPNTSTGEMKRYPASLSKASKEAVSEFMEAADRFILEELGVTIPEPDKTYSV